MNSTTCSHPQTTALKPLNKAYQCISLYIIKTMDTPAQSAPLIKVKPETALSNNPQLPTAISTEASSFTTEAITNLNKRLQEDFPNGSRLSFAQGKYSTEMVIKLDGKVLADGFFISANAPERISEIYKLCKEIQNAELQHEVKLFTTDAAAIRIEVSGISVPNYYDPQRFDLWRLRKIADFIEKRREAYPPIKIEKSSDLEISPEILKELQKINISKSTLSIGGIDIDNSSLQTYATIKYAQTHGFVPRLRSLTSEYAEFDICHKEKTSSGEILLNPVSEKFRVSKNGTVVDESFFKRRDEAIAAAISSPALRSAIEKTSIQEISFSSWGIQAQVQPSIRRGAVRTNVSSEVLNIPRNEPLGLNPNYPNNPYGVCIGTSQTLVALARNQIQENTWSTAEQAAIRIVRSNSATKNGDKEGYFLETHSLPEKIKLGDGLLVSIFSEVALREIIPLVHNLNTETKYRQLNLEETLKVNRELAVSSLEILKKQKDSLPKSEEQLKKILRDFAGIYTFAVFSYELDHIENKITQSRAHGIILALDKNNSIVVYDPNGDGTVSPALIQSSRQGGIILEYEITQADGSRKKERWENIIMPLFHSPLEDLGQITPLNSSN